MKSKIVFYTIMLLVVNLYACSSATSTESVVAPLETQASSNEPLITPDATEIKISSEPGPFPLSEPGPYYIGKLTLNFEDLNRENRSVGISVWYPALAPDGWSGSKSQVVKDSEPNFSGAPYPLIISSAKMRGVLAPYLVTHGFVWAGVTEIDSYPHMNFEMIDQPLDILFALQQIASEPPEALMGMIDSEHVGVIGYSFDGYNTLALSGARIDPQHYLSQCPNPDATTQASLKGYSAFDFGPAGTWNEYASHAGEAITTSEDDLWQPMTDSRIRAVMPMAGEGWWLFGKRGLAAVDRPTLIIVATEDGLYTENAKIFEHLGTSDKTLISFLGENHMMIYVRAMQDRMAHFATAFFGYHLQGREDLKYFYSKEYIDQFYDLAWGVYSDE